MPLHDGQKRYIRNRKGKINVLTCANRWGKSVTIACLQLWHLYYKLGIPNDDFDAWDKTEYRTANIAPHSALTEPVFKTITQIMTSTFPVWQDGKMKQNDCIIGWFFLPDRTINTPPYRQHFLNNSYIEHRSLGADKGGSLQGKPYGYITYDEGGRSDHLETEINDAIMARLFDWQGQLDILSTPSTESKSNLYYYNLYQKGLVGMDGVYTMTGSLRDNTFFSETQIQEQYDLLKDNPLRDQMLEGKFVFGGDTIFSPESINRAVTRELDDGERYQPGHKYIIGTDTAIGSDEMVHTVLDVTEKPFRLARIKAAKGASKSPQMHLNDFVDLVESYYEQENPNLKHALETWNGESVRFYHDIPDWIQVFTSTYGSWRPDRPQTENKNPAKPLQNAAKKADLIIALKKLLEAGEILIPNDQKLIQQLSIFREKDEKSPNDRVMSLALACWEATQGVGFKKVVEFVDW